MLQKELIYIVSDSLGETAESVVRAAASQFGKVNATIEKFSFVRDKQAIDEIILSAKENHAFVVFTLVISELYEYFGKEAAQAGIPFVDIMGTMIHEMTDFFGSRPIGEPGLTHQLDEDYFRKIEAIEFAVKYDDGRDPRGILRADIVLLGVSRTSKTPLSQYLALRRYKVANVPLVPEVDPPDELFQIDPRRCFGLRIDSKQLNSIRVQRLAALGLDGSANYARMERIRTELQYFEEVVKKIGCEVIDVSYKAVEETANQILRFLQK